MDDQPPTPACIRCFARHDADGHDDETTNRRSITGALIADNLGGSGGGEVANRINSVALPAPAVGNVYDMVDHFGELYANIPTSISAVVTWEASVDGDDVSDLWGETTGTYTLEVSNTPVMLSTRNPATWYCARTVVSDTVGQQIGLTLGHRKDGLAALTPIKAEAENHVIANNDVSAYDNALQLVTAFTAGTTVYGWENIADKSFLVSHVLGTPTAARLYEIQNFLGELYRVEPRPTGHVVTWDDYALLSDVSTLWSESASTYRWRGETYPSGVINPATGDVVKEPAGHFRHRNSSNAWVHLHDPDDFIGDYNDETAANNHVTAVGQTSLFSHILHQVATWTIGTPNYVWAKGLDAREVSVDAADFSGNLGTDDTDLQSALDTIDALSLATVVGVVMLTVLCWPMQRR